MRRLLLLILCLCSMWAAQGQVAYDWRYWFDQSPTYEQGSSEGSLHLDVDVSGLSKSLHQIHVQVRDTAGMFSEPVSRYFVVPDDGHDSSKLHYWFDQNNAALHVADLVDGMFDLDVSELPSGFHTLHFVVTDKAGVNSEPAHKGFMRATDNASLKWRYWFDDARDKSVVMPPTTTSLMIDVDSLTDGLHYIHFQAMNESFSEAKTQMFVKVPKTMDLDEMFCLVMIDNSLYSKETINMKNGGMATLDLDVKDLSQGFHKLDVMVMTPSGALSAAYNSYFVRGYLSDDRGALRCLYAFDDETDVHETTYSEGMSHLNLDVAHLEDGPHSVHWMLADKEGAYVSDKRSWFLKVPLGGNGITRYSYWLNDADDAKHETVLAEPKSPHDIIALLPVETMPLRSSCFHFEVKDDVPTLYAKNDIHFTFTDRFNRETSISRQYVDYNVAREVTDITALQTKQTFARPGENDITWFTFEAAPGDTIAFKASQATSLQVFSPSGKELYSVSGDKSVKYGGVHTWEEGVHYLAVHDVTGSKSDITLDYMHMDKHDVVSQDVYVVGDGGASTITFEGNGFNELNAVDFVHEDGEIITSPYIYHTSDSEVGVVADMYQAPRGIYKTIFHFKDDDVERIANLTVEEAVEGKLVLSVSYPRSRLTGTSPQYIFTIKNTGNMTSYRTPISIYIESANTLEGINVTRWDLLDLYEIMNITEKDSLTEYDIEFIKNISDEVGDNIYFYPKGNKFVDGNSGNGTSGGSGNGTGTGSGSGIRSGNAYSGYFFGDIPPNGSKSIGITPRAGRGEVSVWGSVPSNGNVMSGRKGKPQNDKSKNAYCCVRDKIECAANMLSAGIGAIVPGADCIGEALPKGLEAYGYYVCEGEDPSPDRTPWQGLSDILNGYATAGFIAECAKKHLPWKKAKAVLEFIAKTGGWVDNGLDLYDCWTAFTEKNPDCNDEPPVGGTSTPVAPLDPNDIYGYTSESGSKYINDEVRDLNYRIEFENDPEFATASAHVVMVENKLDGTYFELTSFAPTAIKIGEKTESLDGTPNFVRTIDMRPEINVIAEVRGTYDAATGEAKWTITSLDPMTMEPTDDVMQGFLPVNYDGISGIGEVLYDISLKDRFPDGTQIKNKASIIFDNNDPIETPVWTNIIDAVAPTGHVVAAKQKDAETATLTVEGTDERSGVWAYDVYVQYGTKAEWLKVAEKVSPREDGTLDVKIYEGINHGFYVCAVDSAGNVEVKEPLSEVRLDLSDMISGDANGDGSVSVGDMTTVISALKGESPEEYDENGADANHDGIISVEDLQAIIRRILRK